MDSQTSLVAKQCRIQSWTIQIKDCRKRPEDMTVDEWCPQHNIANTNYYYLLKCVRQVCLISMESEPVVVELKIPEIKTVNKCTTSSVTTAVIRGAYEITIELHENAST